MNENNLNKKNNRGLVICVIVLIIAVVILLSLNIYDRFKANEEKEKTIEVSDKKEVNNKKEIKLEDKNKDIVYDLVNEKRSTIDNENGNYILPKVNIDSDYAKEINNEIEQINNKNDDLYKTDNRMTGDVFYKYYVNDNIISIIVIEKTPTDYETEYVYNIDKYTGNYVSNKDLIESKQIKKEDILSKLNDFASNHLLKNTSDEVIKSLSLSFNTLLLGLPMYLGENNELYIISYYHTGAGGLNSYSYIFSYDNNSQVYLDIDGYKESGM